MNESTRFTPEPVLTDEPWYWTGLQETRLCGCVFHELAATDDHCEPVWMGKSMCDKHMERANARVKELQEQGKLPKNV